MILNNGWLAMRPRHPLSIQEYARLVKLGDLTVYADYYNDDENDDNNSSHDDDDLTTIGNICSLSTGYIYTLGVSF